MKQTLRKWGAAAVTTALTLPSMVFAAQGENPFNKAKDMATNVGSEAGIASDKSIQAIIGQIINIVLGFLGIVLLFYFLYAGFLWMTAGGDSKQVDTAKGMMKNAVIGLVIIVAAFAISSFVLTSLYNITQ